MSTIIDRLPKRQYTKTEVCLALADPENFIAGNIASIKLPVRHTERLKRDILKTNLLQVFGITESEYDRLKLLRASWCELIFIKLM